MERKWLILTSVSLGSLMATLDGSIVNIALPAIQTDFRIDLTTVEWVVVAYLLIIGSLLLPFGRLGEVLSFRRVYLVGFAIFTVASISVALRPTGHPRWLSRRSGSRRGDDHGDGTRPSWRGLSGPRARASAGPERRQRVDRPEPRAGPRGHPDPGGHVAGDLPGQRADRALGHRLGRARAARRRSRASGSRSTSGARLSRASRSSRSSWPSAKARAGAGPARRSSACWWPSWSWRWLRRWSSARSIAADDRPGSLPDPAVLGRPGQRRRRLRRPVHGDLPAAVPAAAGSGFSPIEAGLLLTPVPITMALVAPFSGAASDRLGPRLPASAGMGVMVLGLLSLTRLPVDFACPTWPGGSFCRASARGSS